MSKLLPFIKTTLRAIMWVLISFVLIFVLVAALIQVPAIQNKIVHYATSFVSNKTHTRVGIKNISISFPKSVLIEGLFLDDLRNDTLLYAGSVKINLALYDLLHSKLSVSSFALENANVHLYSTATDSLLNFNFLLTAFSDTATQLKAQPQTPSKWTFNIDKVSLKNIRLRYDDVYGGVNVAATLANLKLNIHAIDFGKSVYAIDKLLVESLNANVRLRATTTTETNKPGSVLPKITANSVRINNSTVTYANEINKQSVLAAINTFELNKGSVDLQTETVSMDKLYLSKSTIHYSTIDTAFYADTTVAVALATPENKWLVRAKRIIMDDNALWYQVTNKPEKLNVFDVSHLKFAHVSLEASDLYYSPDTTKVSVKKFIATDQNNFSITKFEAEFIMDQHSVTARNLALQTVNSSIVADLSLQYSSLKALKDSLPFMVMNFDMKDIKVRNSDILYFMPGLARQDFFKKASTLTSVSGTINGAVNHLTGKNLLLRTGVNTTVRTDFVIVGLPAAETALFNFPNLKIITGRADIAMMAGSSVPESIQLPANLSMQVVFKGQIKSFKATVGMGSSYGSANLFATLDKNENFRLKASVNAFDVGSLLKNKAMFGPVSLIAETSGHGLGKNTVEAKIKAAVSQAYINQYTYHNLSVDGNISGQQFEGQISLKDENASFDFDGLVNLYPGQEKYKFSLNVQGADLRKLNFTKDDLRVGLKAQSDLKGGPQYKLNGKATITSLIVVSAGKQYTVDSLFTVAFNEPAANDSYLNNALIGLKYSGAFIPGELNQVIGNFINHYFPLSDTSHQIKNGNPQAFAFELRLHNDPLLAKALFPLLMEFEPALVEGSFNSKTNSLTVKTAIKRIVYGTTSINNFAVDVNTGANELNYSVSAGNISNPQFNLDNLVVDGKLDGKTIFARVSSIDRKQNKKLLVHSQINRNKSNYRLVFDTEDFYLMNKRCEIAADNYIEFGKPGFFIHHLFINNGGSALNVASVHDRFNDDLNIAIKNFKLDDISDIFASDTSFVKGIVEGNILLKRVSNTYGIIADAKINNLIVREVPVGNLTVKADNPTSEKFVIDVALAGAGNNLGASGYYIPKGGANSLSIKAVISQLSLRTIEAFSMGAIRETSGYLSGEFRVGGKTEAPDVTGQLTFNNAFITPSLLNNALQLNHETVQIKTDGIYFDAFTVIDANHQTAVINGAVKMDHFRNFIFDLNVNTKDFLLFNTTVNDNKVFFGRMVIDSRVDVNGPMALPVVNAKIKMKKGSNFTFVVPEDKLTTDKGEGIVEFNTPGRLNPILTRETKKTNSTSGITGFDLSSIIEIDKQATLRLLLDPASTDSLVVKGEAALSLTIDRSGKMSLTGAYNLDDGSYLVSLESVIKRKFDINAGSTIIWSGDPLGAEISINATYSVRASPIDLVADQMSGMSEIDKGVYKQKYPFWVLLKLRGQILHPEISFEIQLPPENKGLLGGAVNTCLNMLNEDPSALNKQVFALLVLGRFIQENPLQTDANGGASTIVRATVGKFLTAQLNQLSSKVVPGVDLNFDIQSYDDYGSGQAQGRTQVEIGLKKQLFNERLSVQVGGTVDVEGEKAKQNSASDITSDVTIEYKLAEDGRFRLKGFRHNQYEGAIDGQLIETGIGVSYVRDFNTWREFLSSPKKQK